MSVGVAGLAYWFHDYAFMQWAWTLGDSIDLIPRGLRAPPDLDVEQLTILLAGLLGFGGMSSFQTHRGVAK